MIQQICSYILFKVMGWSKDVQITYPKKYIICLAPHTSNWDFIIGQLFAKAENVNSNFLMKKEWFRGPLGAIFRKIGGIPVERSKQVNMTDTLAELAIKEETFGLCITPEGTRKPVNEWKKGFYYVALKAQIPILLFGLDYKTKTIKANKIIIPNGDFDSQFKEIKTYFNDCVGKIPSNFIYD